MAVSSAEKSAEASRSKKSRTPATSRWFSQVPERFAKPRLMLILAVFALVSFGLLMVFSATSINEMVDGGNALSELEHQLMFAAAGTLIAAFIAHVDYHVWSETLLIPAWIVTILLLLMVVVTSSGQEAGGATRWLQLGPVRLQPSEFAKVTIVLVAANVCQRYFDDGDYDQRTFAIIMAVSLGIPLLLVLIQPDKGTTAICVATVLVMLYLSGFDGRILGLVTIGGIALFLLYSMRDSYSRARILIFLNPRSDYWGDGYQLMQGIFAFGTGGLFGVGIGASRQKYAYLSESSNDFIYAIVGEECGFIGTVGVLVGFGIVLWAGLRIARYAPDLSGRLIAAGCVSMMMIQLLVNALGLLCLVPLTGKPIPFLSAGGSSLLSSLMLVGMVLSVSHASKLDETASDRRRRDMSVTSRPRSERESELGLVGEAVPRSRRYQEHAAADLSASSAPSGARFHVLDGGATPLVGMGSSEVAERARTTRDASGHTRIDLGPTPAERLRSRTSNDSSSSRKGGRRG